jgi:hypothetical protein
MGVSKKGNHAAYKPQLKATGDDVDVAVCASFEAH